jgi:hypothetical protein
MPATRRSPNRAGRCPRSTDRRFPLTPFNRDLLVYAPFAETPDAHTGATFLIGPDGKANAVTIGGLDEYGMGMLQKAF